jgi:mannose-6-phosphate isomerase-like protein (cupin superfamily)
MAEIQPSLRIPRAPFQFGKCATSEPAELSRGGVEFLRVISAACLECGEPSAKPSELIRRQRGNSFGYFFYSHLGSIALQRLGGLWRVRLSPPPCSSDVLAAIDSISGDVWVGQSQISIHSSHSSWERLPQRSPPLHRHIDEDEIFHIISGTLRFVVGPKELTASAGGTLLGPKGIPHTYRVTSPEGARFLSITAKQQFERYVRALGSEQTREGLAASARSPISECWSCHSREQSRK